MEPNDRLRSARKAAGLSQGQLAELVCAAVGRATVDANVISRLERGAIRWPSRAVRESLSSVLGVPVAQLGFRRPQARPEPVVWAVERGKVTPESVNAVSGMLASTRRLEDQTSAAAVKQAVESLVSIADSHASEAPSSMRISALTLASELHTYLGWISVDLGDDASALRNLDTAVSLAVEADSHDHLAHALSFKGDLALRRGRFHQAVTLSQVSQRDPNVFLALRVYDGYQEAWSHALTGEQRDAERAMLSVDGLLEKVPDADAPDGAYWYDVPFLLTQRATVHEALGRHDEAIHDLETGLAEMPAAHREADWSRVIRSRLIAMLEKMS